MKKNEQKEPPPTLNEAVEAALDKKARNITVLDLKGAVSFTDFFLICSGGSSPQIQAISDEIKHRLDRLGLRPLNIEGYNHAEWILMDYVDFVVHIFSEQARVFYDLERLWRAAHRIPVAQET